MLLIAKLKRKGKALFHFNLSENNPSPFSSYHLHSPISLCQILYLLYTHHPKKERKEGKDKERNKERKKASHHMFLLNSEFLIYEKIL